MIDSFFISLSLIKGAYHQAVARGKFFYSAFKIAAAKRAVGIFQVLI